MKMVGPRTVSEAFVEGEKHKKRYRRCGRVLLDSNRLSDVRRLFSERTDSQMISNDERASGGGCAAFRPLSNG